ncbi:MAG: tetratricopeptide repeat protein, partial [Bacteroidia bacterium]|nr:tetratricopeptide repeat protein [Bacteroidia bacterium]
EIKKEIGDKTGIVNSFNNLGLLFTKLKKYQKAKQYLHQGLNLSKEIGNKEGQGIAYTALAIIDTLEGNFKGAYYLDKKAAVMKDSIFNERFRKEIATLTIQFETEKKNRRLKHTCLKTVF